MERKTVYEGRVLNLHLDRVRLPDGQEARREVVEHPGAAAIVALDEEGRVILVSQYRYTVGETLWEIPAGRIDRGEDPLTCARRELEEETGYRAESWEEMATFYSSPGFTTEQMHVFLARGLSHVGARQEEDEFIRVKAVAVGEALAGVQEGRFRDAKTIVGLWALAHRLAVPGGSGSPPGGREVPGPVGAGAGPVGGEPGGR